MQLTVTVYRRNPRSQWRWRIQSRNRKIVASSSEAFVRLSRCLINLYMATGFRVDPDNHNFHTKIRIRFEDVRGRMSTSMRELS